MSLRRTLKFCLGLFLLTLLIGLAPSVGAAPPVMPALDGYLSGCSGQYYNNMTLSGSPVLTRTDGWINFFWPEGSSPAPGIVNTSQYSVLWTCTVNAPTTGNYTFTMTADDGMNLLIDGNLTIWAWYDQGPSAYAKTVNLNAGAHTVTVQYYNDTLGGTAQVSTSLSGSTGGGTSSFPDWQGQYYNNMNLAGAPVLVRDDPNIAFNWGSGSPDPSVPPQNFSVRWTRSLYFNGGTWQFTTTTDDGVQLWVDSNLLINQWHDQTPTTYSANIPLATGYHTVVMQYFQDTGTAFAQLTYGQVGNGGAPGGIPAGNGVWVGQYYNNPTLSGSPVFYQTDPALNFNWGYGSPNPTVPVDNFSARWDSYQNIPTNGVYTIVATSDDGIRVWLDGALVIDGWFDHSLTSFSATRNLSAGTHAFHVEYYERTGTAVASVQIFPGSGQGCPNCPPPYGGEIIVNDLGPGWQAGGRSSGWRAAASGYAGHAFWTFNDNFAVPYYNWARWYPTLPKPGTYDVYAYIPSGMGSTLNARYAIYHTGRYDYMSRSQAFYRNQWMPLGTYNFRGGGGEFVSLSDVTYECYLCKTLAFDAVKFRPHD